MVNITKQDNFNSVDQNYLNLLQEAREKVQIARIQTARAACQQQMALYWWFGQQIVTAQEKYGWGRSIVENLSKDLKRTFGGSIGFSSQNLWYMRQFYLEYKEYPNLQRLVGEIAWGSNLDIFSKVKDLKAREYYLNAVRDQGWTRSVLVMQIKSQAYERHLLVKKQHNFEKALPEHLAEQADRTMKDIYMLDTLGFTEPVLESVMENRMVTKIKNIMLELGYGFTFIGNQYRIVAKGNEYFIDLLFYNRKLKSLVAMELKTGKFQPEYAGKMNFYLNLLDDFVREPDENPSIGIILCSERDKFEVEYALRGLNKPVGVSEFRLTKTLPIEWADKLPRPDELKNEIMRELGAEGGEEILNKCEA